MDLGVFREILAGIYRRAPGEDNGNESVYMEMLDRDVSLVVRLHIEHVRATIGDTEMAGSMILLKKIYQDDAKCGEIDANSHTLMCNFMLEFWTRRNSSPYVLNVFIDACSVIGPFYFRQNALEAFTSTVMGVIASQERLFAAAAIECLVRIRRVIGAQFSVDNWFLVTALHSGFIQTTDPDLALSSVRLLFEFGRTEEFLVFAAPVAVFYRALSTECLPIALSDLYYFCCRKWAVRFFHGVMGELMLTLNTIIAGSAYEEHVKVAAAETVIRLVVEYGNDFDEFLTDATRAMITATCCVKEDDAEILMNAEERFIDELVSDLCAAVVCYKTDDAYPNMVMGMAMGLITNEVWSVRRAAIVSVCALLRGWGERLGSVIERIRDILRSVMKDANPLVRQAAHVGITALVTKHSDYVLEVAEDMIRELMEIIGAETDTHARYLELNELSEICRCCSYDAISDVTTPLKDVLSSILPRAKQMEQLVIIECFVSLCVSPETRLEQCAVFMPTLWNIHGHCPVGVDDSPRVRTIRLLQRILNNAHLTADIVGQFMSSLLVAPFGSLTEKELCQTMSSIRQFAMITPTYFSPFIAVVMEQLKSVIVEQLDTETYPHSCDLSTLQGLICVLDRHTNQIITHRRSQLSGIRDALDTVSTLIEVFGPVIAPLTVCIVDTVAVLIRMSLFSPVQVSALNNAIALVTAYGEHGAVVVGKFKSSIMSPLIAVLSEMNDTEVWQLGFVLVKEIIKISSACSVSVADIAVDVCGVIPGVIETSQYRRICAADSCTAENNLEYELSLLIGTIFTVLPSDITALAPLFVSIPGKVVTMMVLARLTAIGFDERATLVPMINQAISSGNGDDTWYASLAFAVAVSKLPDLVESISNFATSILVSCHAFPDNEIQARICEGAVVAIAAIMSQGKRFAPDLVELWFAQLPLTHDVDDTIVVYEVLAASLGTTIPVATSESITRLMLIVHALKANGAVSRRLYNYLLTFVRDLAAAESTRDTFNVSLSSVDSHVRRTITLSF